MPKTHSASKSPASRASLLAVEVLCFAAAQVPADATEPPNELIVCPWGESPTRKGVVIVNGKTMEVFNAEMKARRWDRVALDYQHNTVSPHQPGTPEHDAWLAQEPRDVAAFASVEVRKDVGLVYTNLRWTDSGKTSWKNFEDISPAVVRNARGEVIALHSTALCRAGEMDGLALFASLDPNTNFTGIYLKPDDKTMTDLLKKLLVKQGVKVPADATQETICALAADHLDGGQEDPPKEEGKKEDAKPDAVTELTATVKGLVQTVTTLTAEVTSLKAGGGVQTDAQKRADLLAEATRQGKVIPLSAEEIDKLPVDVFTSLVKNLGVTVPTTHKVNDPAKETITTFSAEERSVMKQLNITEERFKALKAEEAAAKA